MQSGCSHLTGPRNEATWAVASLQPAEMQTTMYWSPPEIIQSTHNLLALSIAALRTWQPASMQLHKLKARKLESLEDLSVPGFPTAERTLKLFLVTGFGEVLCRLQETPMKFDGSLLEPDKQSGALKSSLPCARHTGFRKVGMVPWGQFQGFSSCTQFWLYAQFLACNPQEASCESTVIILLQRRLGHYIHSSI